MSYFTIVVDYESPIEVSHDDIVDLSCADVQCFPESEYSKINSKIRHILGEILQDPHQMIHILEKSTRVGVTTSLILNPKIYDIRLLLCVPTNTIGLDTFSKTVKIAEQKAILSKNDHHKIYGCVFGSNVNMCLKVYKQIYHDLLIKHPVNSASELAVLKDLPFLFKKTCMITGEDGQVKNVCPYYNCIHVGYPKDLKGNITPVMESKIMKIHKDTWCSWGNHHVKPDDTCMYHRIIGCSRYFTCVKCKYFEKEHEFVSKENRPYCAYATIFRHLEEDTVNIIVHDSSYIGIEDIMSSSEKVINLSRSEVIELIDDGFIPVDSQYQDSILRRHNENNVTIPDLKGLLDNDGKLKDDIQIILDVKLKTFDILTLTYTKILALFESVKNSMGGTNPSESIVNSLMYSFDGVVCDEVSHLVAQPPLSFTVYSVSKEIDKFGSIKPSQGHTYSFFDKVDSEIQQLQTFLNTKFQKRRKRDEDGVLPEDRVGVVDYFYILVSYFKELFADVYEWVMNPNDVMSLFDNDRRKYYVRKAKKSNVNAFDMVMEQISSNKIPKEIIRYIRNLQKSGVLKGKSIHKNYTFVNTVKYIRNKIRYIDVARLRTKMVDIRNKIKKLLEQDNTIIKQNDMIDNDTMDISIDALLNDNSFDYDEDSESTIISTDNLDILVPECKELVEQYLQLKREITIKDDEIAIINEILFEYNDDINIFDQYGTSIGHFDGYEERVFVIIGWCKVNLNILHSCFGEEGEYTHGEIDNIFINMYTFLISIGIEENIDQIY
jgi:hypothetical protein